MTRHIFKGFGAVLILVLNAGKTAKNKIINPINFLQSQGKKALLNWMALSRILLSTNPKMVI